MSYPVLHNRDSTVTQVFARYSINKKPLVENSLETNLIPRVKEEEWIEQKNVQEIEQKLYIIKAFYRKKVEQ